MTVETDTDTISVEQTNEMTISVTLKTDEERYDLFENPEIVLEFPSVVETVDISMINLLYKNGLSIESWNIYTNVSGNQVIDVRLSGSQLEYTPGSVQEGTTLVIYASVSVNRLTADSSDVLKLTYMNKDTIRKSYMLEGKESEDVKLNFVGRGELIEASGLEVLGGESITCYDDDVQKIQIDSENETETTLKISGTIVNNFETATGNVSIVGRIPFAGNKDGEENDLGTTLNSTFLEGIETSGLDAKVYYSEEENADRNQEGWVEDAEDLGKYKSYKIVVSKGSLEKGESLSFEYKVNLPANIGYNAKAYATYTVYYTLDGQIFFDKSTIGAITEEREVVLRDIEEANKSEINAVEDESVQLTVGMQVSQGGKVLAEGDSVYERQILKYTVVVQNTSSKTINNITVKGKAENSNVYDWEYITVENYGAYGTYTAKRIKEYTNEEKEYSEFSIESLAPGESKTLEYEVVVKDLSEIETQEVYGVVTISADEVAEKIVESQKNNIIDAELEVSIRNDGTESLDGTDVITNTMISMSSYVKNISASKLDEVKYVVIIPNELIIDENYITSKSEDEAKVSYEIKKENGVNKLIFTITNLDENEKVTLYYSAKVGKFDYTELSRKISVISYGETENEKYYANDLIKNIYQGSTKLEYEWKSDNANEYLNDGDEVKFTLTVKNVGQVDSENISIQEAIPSGLEIQSIKIYDEETFDHVAYENLDDIVISMYVSKDSEKTVEISAKANSKLYKIDQDKIEFSLNINYPTEKTYTTDVISYKIDNPNVTVFQDADEIDENDDDENSEIVLPNDNNTNNDAQEENVQNVEQSENINEDVNSEENVEENIEEIHEENAKTYSISGKVWIDKDKDGVYSNGEEGKSALVVMLYGATKDGGIDTSDKVQTTITDEVGKYQFYNVKSGNYVVVFSYDSSLYNVTKYQVQTAKSTENSDAVAKTVTLNGVTGVFGLTDMITVSDKGIFDIDMGLVTKNDFDLSLDKYIESVTVKNDSGTKTYNFENGTNEKLEIRSKYYKSSDLIITYKIVIKNDGDVNGYINKIVDYIPDGVTVDLNQNLGWYYGDDGNLYYNGLVGRVIEPGKTQEIKLVLNKSLSDGSAVRLSNSAEIAEYTNALGYEDIDSVASNNNSKEDDYGTAILTISISTGQIPQYVVIILIVIIIIALVIIVFIKIKTKKKIYK
jgi:uncharacterized repeat protein (TIGR01451 family)